MEGGAPMGRVNEPGLSKGARKRGSGANGSGGGTNNGLPAYYDNLEFVDDED